METAEAIAACRRWFAYIDRQEAKTKRLQELAALARTGPDGAATAKAELRRLDGTPSVHDAAALLPAVKHLVGLVERTTTHPADAAGETER